MLKPFTDIRCRPFRIAPLALLAIGGLILVDQAAGQGERRYESANTADASANQPYVIVPPSKSGETRTPGGAPQRQPASPTNRTTARTGAADRSAMNRVAAGGEESIPLLPPEDPELTNAPPRSPMGMLWTVASSLAVVLGLFFAVAMLGRKGGVGGPAPLPSEAFEVLGRAPLTGRQHAQVVRFGDKLILLSVSSSGVDSLAEVTSPEEVERIATLCQQQRPDSVTQTFRQVLTQFSREPARGFVGADDTDAQPSATAADTAANEFERLA